MRVLLADKLPDRARVRLASRGFEVRAEADVSGEALTEAIRSFDPHVLVVRSTRVEAAHVAAGNALGLVVRAGAGVNTIDLDACSSRGVFVANCPGKNAVAVAELTLGLILALDRKIPDNVVDFRGGKWNKRAYSTASGLSGRTLGLIGFGDIGRAVARRARAFDLNVVVWSRSLTPEGAAEAGVRYAERPEDVAARADILSVHLALTPETRGLVGESILGALRPGASVINTARAEVVDEVAFRRLLDAHDLWAALDVPSDEPAGGAGAFTHPLASHPRVYVTHHIGASTEQAQLAVAEEACRIIEGFKERGEVDNVVNVETRSEATHALVVRHLDRVGVLASVLGVLREADLNVEEMDNTIFAGGAAAVARIRVSGTVDDGVIARVREQANVLAVDAMDLRQPGR